jgi:hypothetical protein
MTIGPIMLIILFFGFLPSLGEPGVGLDSAKSFLTPKPYRLKLTTRLSSMGVFSYSGRIISDNPALDFNFNYDRKSWGFMFFKAFDLYDRTSDNNFALGLFYKNFKVGEKLTLTPYVGFVLEQSRKIAGQGSDATLILNVSYKINKSLTLESSSLFSNLALESNEFDWVNRVRLVYSSEHLDLALLGWHNNQVFDQNQYCSSGFNFTYGRIPVAKNVFINTGITAIVMIQTSNEVLYPKKNGLVFTFAVVVH